MSSKISLQAVAPLPSVRTLLADTFRVYRKHFFALMGFAGWLVLPLTVHILLRITFGDSERIQPVLLVVAVLSVVISTWSYCHVVLFTAFVHATGKPYAQLPRVRSILLPVFLTFVLYGLVVGVGLFFIIPFILFTVWFAFAPTIAVLEQRNPFTAFSQSRERVRGRFFPVLLRLWSMDFLFLVAYLFVVICMHLALGYDIAHLDITAALPVPMDIILNAFEIVTVPLITIYRTILVLALEKQTHPQPTA